MNAKVWGTCSTAALVLGIATLTSGHNVQAGIAQSPLTLGGNVKPNLMMVIDNSGSMDGEGLFPTNDGALWWNTAADSFWGATTGPGGRAGLNFNDAGAASATWKKYTYLFPATTDVSTGNRIYGDGVNDHFAVPPTVQFAFTRSPDYNKQYYQPSVDYAPWRSTAAHSFANAVASAAKSDPIEGATTIDLTTDTLTQSFRLHPGMQKPNGTLMTDAERIDAKTEEGKTYAFAYKPATYYLRTEQAAAYTVNKKNYNCATPDPAAFAAFVANPGSAVFPSGVHSLGPDGACLVRYEIAPGSAQMQNFANWFQYHRKRHLALRAGMGEAFADIGGVRVGGTPINGMPNSITMYDFDEKRDAVYDFFYNVKANNGGTPNRQGLNFAGSQYDSNTEIVQFTCQKNFILQFTDGFSNPTNPPQVGKVDAGMGKPYQDDYSNTIADIAMKYYIRIRSAGSKPLAGGKVPVPEACDEAQHDPSLDCNADPHVNHYGITLGARGNIFGVSHENVSDAYQSPPTWAEPTAERAPVQVDDLYHASINGRGEMLNARSSTELTARLKQALADILANGVGAGSRTAVSSSRAGNGNQLFQATFNSAQWTGELVAFDIANGSLGAVKWKAAALVPAHAARKISFGAAATSFEWTQLSAVQQTAFNRNPTTGAADALGEARIAWLRGDVSVQKAQGGSLRDRATALGDIVNSSPRYVGSENFGYDRLPANAPGRDSYQTYRFGKSDRTPMVYVGANDGMLHAFGAKDGIEKWAWIPSEFLATDAAQPIPALSQLPRADYRHRYFVDGQPAAGDAYFDDKWHTVLLTPMGAGGRSIAALDITDTAVGAKVLWEFTDAALGHVIGQPSIQRMANGKFAAIFGSGYGLDASAKLFVVDIETGTLLAKIDTDPGFVAGSGKANGLSAPYPVDVNGDTVIDMIYAGDLWGNLWRFDVNSATATSWAVHHGPSNAPRPLMTACASGSVDGPYACAAGYRQPITVRPVVGRGPGGVGQTIYFGTGKLFETGDNTLAEGAVGPVQSFYAVHDDNGLTSVAGRSALLSQAILAELTLDEGDYRVTSNNVLTGDHKGWYIDLVHAPAGFKGERVIADPVLQGGRIIFTTFMPGDACSGGSDGWLMELNARDGSRFTSPVIDINGDGLYTETTDDSQGDTLDHNGQQVPASGVKSTVGGLFTPNIINIPGTGNQRKLMQGAEGKIQEVGERDSVARGRTSWRQFWP